jgi:hypothetical protein
MRAKIKIGKKTWIIDSGNMSDEKSKTYINKVINTVILKKRFNYFTFFI